MELSLADWVRLYAAIVSLALIFACIWCLFRPSQLGQRLRFASLALLGVVIAGGNIENLGQPGNWRVPVLAVGVTVAVAGCWEFLQAARGRHERR